MEPVGRPCRDGRSPTGGRSAPRSTATACGPARYVVTDDDYIVMASEVGVLDIPESKIVKKWRLQPARCCWSTWSRGASSTTTS
jgi:hypothetical protein